MNWLHEIKLRNSVRNLGRLTDRELNEVVTLLIENDISKGDALFVLTWNEVVRRYLPALISYSKSKGSNTEDAEDIAQDALANAWDNFSKYDPSKSSIKKWIYIKASNVASKKIKVNRARLEKEISEEASEALDVKGGSLEEQAEERQFKRDILVCAETCLNDEQRSLWIAVILEGKTRAEIGRLPKEEGEEKSNSSVNGKFSWANAKMRKCLKAKGHKVD